MPPSWRLSNAITNSNRQGRAHLLLLTATLSWLCIADPLLAQTIVELRHTYHLVANVTVDTLPNPLRHWFDNRDTLIAATFTHNKDEISLRVEDESGQQHITWLQSPAPPAQKKTSKKFVRWVIVTPKQNADLSNTLPERIIQQHVSLIEAFRHGDSTLATTICGQLIHNALDACLPSHVAVVGHNWPDQKSEKLDRRMERLAFHESRVLGAQRERFDYEIRIWPQRLRKVDDMFQLVLKSLRQASIVGMEVYNNTEFAAQMAPGSDESVVLLLRGQLEAAAILSASLIQDAWIQAGSPSQASGVQSVNGNIVTRQTKTSGFLGSKNSKIYHLSTCPYVKRIKPGNLVHFDNAAAVRSSKRKACRTCKPDG